MVFCIDIFWTLFVRNIFRKWNRPKKPYRIHRNRNYTYINITCTIQTFKENGNKIITFKNIKKREILI